MELTSLLIGAIIGVVIGAVLWHFFQKPQLVKRKAHEDTLQKLNEQNTQLALTEDRLRQQQELSTGWQREASAKEQEIHQLNASLASLNTQLKLSNEHLRDKLESQKREIEEMQKTAQLQFEKLAQQIFEEKTGKFTEANKVNMESLLKPLSENIDAFKKKVEETYDKESKQRFSLDERIKDLIDNTHKVSQEANNLAAALKGQAKKQGDWGETILESILEKSGLVRDREYFLQENLKDEDGNNLRPDVIVHLPDERNIVIDSKVSLNAYIRFMEADETDAQDIFSSQHLQALYQHIDQLSNKKYQEYTNSLDFVIMFVAVEPAYLMAIQSDPELWSYAYGKRVLLISPTNLIAVLKIVADLWKRELQNKNALAIADEGARLYDKLIGFLSTMEDIGKHITKSQEAYLTAIGQLKEGRGNLVGRAEKLRKLGVKSAKRLPPTFQSMDPDDEEPMGLPQRDEEESQP
jgi:DNA recombination protein RmuC